MILSGESQLFYLHLEVVHNNHSKVCRFVYIIITEEGFQKAQRKDPEGK